jgi:hypothetical protein
LFADEGKGLLISFLSTKGSTYMGGRVARRHSFKQKIPIWVKLDIGIFYGHLVSLLCPFWGNLVYFFPFLYVASKNLATLIGRPKLFGKKYPKVAPNI